MIPKVESASDVVAIATLLDEIEVTAGLPAGHIGLEILIESAKGLLHLNEICGASNRIESIILGPGDMAASLGLPLTTIDASLHENAAMSPFGYIFAKLLVAGRAHGLHVIDGPLFSVKDLDGLKRSARVTADFGFDGKWALTPDQVAVINEVFSPNDDVVAQSRRLLEAYENATSNEAVGAVLFDGAMIDEASASLARSVLARAQRAAKH
jgi:citrate lyase subunit beta/citryl-CoA lyase